MGLAVSWATNVVYPVNAVAQSLLKYAESAFGAAVGAWADIVPANSGTSSSDTNGERRTVIRKCSGVGSSGG